jgi:adenylate cyclase
MWSVYMVRADYRVADELSEQLVRLAEGAGDRGLLVQAHFSRGFTRDKMGYPLEARDHYERVLALYDPAEHAAHCYVFGIDPRLHALARLCWVLWVLGYPDRGRRTMEECLALAEGGAHPFSTNSALLTPPQMYVEMGEPRRVRELAERVIAMAGEHGFLLNVAYCGLYCAWAAIREGDVDGGLAGMHRNLAILEAIGADMARTGYLIDIADALGKAGRPREGLEVAGEAIDRGTRNGEGYHEPDFYRVRGELRVRLAAGGVPRDGAEALLAAAEADFDRALELSRGRGARSYELRAATAKARLWLDRGMAGDARRLLGEVYGRFAEGFDTADLGEARRLLELLSCAEAVDAGLPRAD